MRLFRIFFILKGISFAFLNPDLDYFKQFFSNFKIGFLLIGSILNL